MLVRDAIDPALRTAAEKIKEQEEEKEHKSRIPDPARIIDSVRSRSKRVASEQIERVQEGQRQVQSIVWYALIGIGAIWFISSKK